MNALDTNLYNYLPEQWKGLYDTYAGSSTDPSGKDGFAAFLATTSGGRAFLENLESTGALPSVQLDPILNPTPSTTTTTDTAGATTTTTSGTAATGDSGQISTTEATATAASSGSAPNYGNYYDFTTGLWQDYNVGKMELYNSEPGMGVFLAENPEFGSIFVSGTVEQAATICALYERSLYSASTEASQLDVTT